MRILTTACTLFLLTWGCSERQPMRNNARIDAFYNLDSLITTQVEILAGNDYDITKTVRLDDQLDTADLLFDSATWRSELDPVTDLDLNYPRYVGAIDIEKGANTLEYLPKTGQELNIRYVRYTFDGDGNLLSLEGKFVDDKASTIYSTSRTVRLRFSDNVLSEYRVNGYQKMITQDTTKFEVIGVVSR